MQIWTDEATELLKSLWATDSATQVADKLGAAGHGYFTRNAVIGKLHRLGLGCKDKSRTEQQTRREYRAPRVKVSSMPVGSVAMRAIHAIKRQQKGAPQLKAELFVCQQLPDIAPRNIGLLDLQPNDCRWPTSDDLPHTFCALPKLKGSSYCAAHARLSFGLGTTAERIAHKGLEKVA